MSKSTNNTRTSEEQSWSDQQDNSNSNSITENESVKGTPFRTVRNEELWYLMWGKYVLTPGDNTKDDCIDRLQNDYWNIMGTFVMSVMTAREEQINAMMEAMKKRTETLANPDLINH